MDIRILSIAAFMASLCAFPAQATVVFTREFTCPVGGEEFEDYDVASTSSWGQRPDGKAIGGVSPWPIIECPGNGFPMYKDEFTQAELAELSRLVVTPQFQEMRQTETSYRRLWWLRKEMGADDYTLASNLLAASWETEEDPARKARYQADFAIAADSLARTDAVAEDWFWLTLRGANAFRELGRYADAARLLGETDSVLAASVSADEREGARYLVDGLAALIAEGNPVAEPANLVGARNAVARCRARPQDMTASEHASCDSPEYREAVAQFEAYETEETAAAMADADANMEAAAQEAGYAAESVAEALADVPPLEPVED